MGQIPQTFIDDLLARLDIAEVIGERLKLRRAGANLVACCPFHAEKTPSFSVSPAKQFYHCFGCGASGDVIRFVMEHEGLHFVEAVESLAQRLGLVVPSQAPVDSRHANDPLLYRLLSEAKVFYENQLRKHALAPKVHAYLKGRGLSGKTVKQFCVGFAPPAWDALYRALGTSPERIQALLSAGLIIERSSGAEGFYDRFRDRIVFPIHDKRGRVLGFGGRTLEAGVEPKYLNSPETPVFTKGKSLYGLYEARLMHQQAHNRLLVVEGYMDVLSLVQAGIHPVVASLGTALTDKQIDSLFAHSAELVFCFDGDAPGQAAAKRALPLILSHMKEGRRARFMLLPNSEDPDAFVQRHGAQVFLDRVDQALSLSDFLFDSLMNQKDLHRLENRAQLVTEARPLIQKVPEGILQQMLYRRLAELAQIEPDTFISQKQRDVRKYPAFKPKTAAVPMGRLPSPAMRAMAMLLSDRSLIHRVEDPHQLAIVDVPGIALLCATIVILRADPEASLEAVALALPDELKSQFSGKKWQSLVDFIPEQGVEAEFLGALQRLKERAEEQVMEGVLVKAKLGSLSLEEKQYLNHLLIHRDKNRVD